MKFIPKVDTIEEMIRQIVREELQDMKKRDTETESAFDEALATGRLTTDETKYNYVGDFMYMGMTKEGEAAFKHIHTRGYIPVKWDGDPGERWEL